MPASKESVVDNPVRAKEKDFIVTSQPVKNERDRSRSQGSESERRDTKEWKSWRLNERKDEAVA